MIILTGTVCQGWESFLSSFFLRLVLHDIFVPGVLNSVRVCRDKRVAITSISLITFFTEFATMLMLLMTVVSTEATGLRIFPIVTFLLYSVAICVVFFTLAELSFNHGGGYALCFPPNIPVSAPSMANFVTWGHTREFACSSFLALLFFSLGRGNIAGVIVAIVNFANCYYFSTVADETCIDYFLEQNQKFLSSERQDSDHVD